MISCKRDESSYVVGYMYNRAFSKLLEMDFKVPVTSYTILSSLSPLIFSYDAMVRMLTMSSFEHY